MNKNNYKFSKADENEIIKWIEHHLMVNWIFCNSNNLEDIEQELIGKYMPVLNLNHNPSKLDLLLQLREECKRIANS